MAVLNMDYRQSSQPSGQQSDPGAVPLPVNPPPQQIQQSHRPGIGQSGKDPPYIAQIQGIDLGKKLNGRAEKYQ